MPQHREDLDALRGCSVPGCRVRHGPEAIYLHARCHPQSPAWASYRDGVLTVECAQCRRPIVAVVVASRTGGGRGSDPPAEEAVP